MPVTLWESGLSLKSQITSTFASQKLMCLVTTQQLFGTHEGQLAICKICFYISAD